ncbi:WecB/TagA/CpsF family glycosyltransferase [Azospirillum thermophilum]|uniref:Glycosyltransferase n=1 Tax=Azospirillum thermophilum TaxID=2202148 RepID=A0A2S2CMY0_9PROT|nr:WecB/TagA/CpsF family glycosyltransferase [Azospirillum thermophilum]AWK85826.1 glycosyltransferase [Azospirillum thermophilum]
MESGRCIPPIVNVLGVGLRAQRMADAVESVTRWIERRVRTYVCVADVHSVVRCQDDPALKSLYNDAGMVVTDGMPLVWLARRAGHEAVERVYGPDLMLELCALSVERGWRHAFYGATDEVLAKLRGRLESRFPGLRIVDCQAPPFRPLTEDEDRAAVERINAARPDILWVGLGAPKQERWMAGHLGRLDVPVMIGVGAAFDFHAGTKPQAPRWMQRNGLEWLFRLASEPRRLARRYAVHNTRFLWLIAQQQLGLREFPLIDGSRPTVPGPDGPAPKPL